MKRLSPAAQDGLKAAEWLLERAPRALFEEYRRRPGALGTAWQARCAADAEVIAAAEERAWYAAWNAVMGLYRGQDRDNG